MFSSRKYVQRGTSNECQYLSDLSDVQRRNWGEGEGETRKVFVVERKKAKF